MLMPISNAAVSPANAQMILFPTPYTRFESVRVCCSRACAFRDGADAGFTIRLVSARHERLRITATPKMIMRCSRLLSVNSGRFVRKLDIGLLRGEYTIGGSAMQSRANRVCAHSTEGLR